MYLFIQLSANFKYMKIMQIASQVSMQVSVIMDFLIITFIFI